MVARATKEGYLRSTMKYPLTDDDPGNNIGMNIPDFTCKFVPGDSIQRTYITVFHEGEKSIATCPVIIDENGEWQLKLRDLGPFLVDMNCEGRNHFDELDAIMEEKRKKRMSI